MKKKLMSILLVLVMLTSMFAGCGKKESADNEGTGEKVTLTVGIPRNTNVTDMDDNAFTKYLEENLNMELEFVYFASSSSDYIQQVTLMSVSPGEELPDVLWGMTGFNRTDVYYYGEDGIFQDLTDLIDKYGKNYKEQLSNLSKEQRERIELEAKSPTTGEIYGMPLYNSLQTMDLLQNKMFINQQWLDKVGMKAPTNVDELYNVLKAFKTQDPNGNGKADEIPMFSTTSIWAWIMNAFVYYNIAQDKNVTDGKVWSVITTDEYREGLKFINKLCTEGLLDKLTFTGNTSEARTLISGEGKLATVGIWDGHPTTWTDNSTEILDQYVALAPLADETGKGGYGVVCDNTLNWSAFITKDCKNPEAAMKFLDFFYKDETVTRMRWGEKDVDWEYAEGENYMGRTSYFKIISNMQSSGGGNQRWWNNGLGIITEKNYINILVEENISEREKQTERLCGELYEVMKNFKTPKETLPDSPVIGEEDRQIYEENSSSIYLYYKNVRDLFMSGEKDPSNDAQWKEFIDTIETSGNSTNVKIMQKLYDSEYKK